MNKKSKITLIILLCLLVGGCVFLYFYHKNTSNNNPYKANKISTNNTSNNSQTQSSNSSTSNDTAKSTSSEGNTKKEGNTTSNEIKNENTTSNENKQNEANQSTNQAENTPKNEEQISTFKTKIYSKDSARQNNISITCNTLNDTIVKNGEVFSFCGTVGQATTSKGYQEADIYDNNGKKKKGLGGGNCQISSTLYNAVLAVSSLVVTERHEHSNNVPYVAKGKDAAVAYGSYDFKFRNNSGNDIKIKASTDGSYVTTTLLSLK